MPVLNPWVLQTGKHPAPSRRLFCFPFAGGGGSVFRKWAAYVPTDIELCPVQLPGREGRISEPPFNQMDELADAATSALLPLFDLPFAFFGHSMGALLAFEIARRLQKAGRPGPDLLIASAAVAPQVPTTSISYNLPASQLIDELRRLEGTPREVLDDAELIALVLPLIRADFQVVETYRFDPGPPLECPIVAMGGSEDPHVSPEQLETWCQLTNGEFARYLMSGGHFYVLHTAQIVVQAALHYIDKFASFGRFGVKL